MSIIYHVIHSLLFFCLHEYMDLQKSIWRLNDAYFELNYYMDTLTYIRYRSYKVIEEKSVYYIEAINSLVNLDSMENEDEIELINTQSGCCLPIVNKFYIKFDNNKGNWYLETNMFHGVKYYLQKN